MQLSEETVLQYLYGSKEDYNAILTGKQISSELLLKELLKKNEIIVNFFYSKFIMVAGGAFVLSALLSALGLFSSHAGFSVLFSAMSAVILIGVGYFGVRTEGKNPHLKTWILVASVIVCVFMQLMDAENYWVFTLPVFFSTRYYNIKLTRKLAWTEVICSFLCGIISLVATMWIEQRMDLLDRDIVISLCREEFEIFVISLLVLNFSAIFAGFASRRGIAMMRQMAETSELKQKVQIQAQQTKMDISISQLQPHFLYNALTAIMAIDGNPDETVDAITDFGKYLRENLDAISGKPEIPIRMELEHVKRYVKLEQLRFKSRLNVVYQIRSDGFLVPPLTVQMLVENAVKHGVTRKKQGGTVTVTTEEDQKNFIIRVEDDGVGFDPSRLPDDGREHVGITSVRARLSDMYQGSLTITSEIGSGTTAEILIPKVNNHIKTKEQ